MYSNKLRYGTKEGRVISARTQSRLEQHVDGLRDMARLHKQLASKASQMADDLSELWDETNQGDAYADGGKLNQSSLADLERGLIGLRKQQVIDQACSRFAALGRRRY